MNITLTGASGFIGQRLIQRLLTDGHKLHVLGRKRGALPDTVDFSTWDVLAGEPPLDSLSQADAVIHMAGEPVAQRWTAAAKRLIGQTRTLGTSNLVRALGRLEKRPEVLLSASAVGYYGSRGDETLTESSAPGSGFLADLCVEWEQRAGEAAELGMRVLTFRTGLVLGPDGGALKQMLPPFRLGMGGPLASGKHWMSWIHVDDMLGLLCFALSQRALSGALNATAPEPARNSDFTQALAEVVHRPAIVPVPEFALRVLYGDMAGILIASQRVVPERALGAGYTFQYREIAPALAAAVGGMR